MPRGLCLVLLVSACAAAPDDVAVDSDTDVPEPATASWMGDVFADAPDVALGRMLLPGAFNASSYACAAEHGISPHAPSAVKLLWDTLDPDPEAEVSRQRIVDWSKMQTRSIGAQLVDGIRAVEINVTDKDGVITTWHSIYGVPVTEVLDALVAFAVDHPTEPVIVTFGVDLEAARWPDFADLLAAPRAGGRSVCDLLWDGEGLAAAATYGEVVASGRTLVWGASGDLRAVFDARGDCPMSDFRFERQWSLTTSPDGVDARLAATVDSRDPTAFLQNDLVFSLDGTDDALEQAGYVLDYPSLADAQVAFGFAGDFATRMIAAHDGSANMNLFAGAYYEDSELVQAVIDRNRARLAGE
ncbi:MAG: hypothetical protein H6733_09705 [Alphaproteobacteria bacterium]|nr:hypothetical protein [Alphaproteobacteria bacterium]